MHQGDTVTLKLSDERVITVYRWSNSLLKISIHPREQQFEKYDQEDMVVDDYDYMKFLDKLNLVIAIGNDVFTS